ncbi:MAG: hypothetical protein O2854_05950 [Chloroflexi bacterium]|nr:hypothetical protein [Chloroflexota bacterium]
METKKLVLAGSGLVAAMALSIGVYAGGVFDGNAPNQPTEVGTVGMVLPGYENTVSDTDIDLAGGIREEGSGEDQDAAGRAFPGYEHISDTPGQEMEPELGHQS